MRHQFLNHPSQHYTHLIIAPDDLLIEDPNSINILLDDFDNLSPPYIPEETIISGFCNVDNTDNIKNANVSDEDTSIEVERHKRFYRFMKLERLRRHARQHPDNPLIPVYFAGFPLMVIPRNVVENIEFRNDSVTGEFDSNGCCVDVTFCHDAIEKGYKILVDSRIDLKHLKHNDVATNELIQKAAKTTKDHYHYFEYSKEIKVKY